MHANYASNNRKRDNVKIIRIALDLHDVIADSLTKCSRTRVEKCRAVSPT